MNEISDRRWMSEMGVQLQKVNEKLKKKAITSSELDVFLKFIEEKNHQFESLKEIPEVKKAEESEEITQIETLLTQLDFLKKQLHDKSTQEKVSSLLATLFLPGKPLDHLVRNLDWLKKRYKKVSKIDPQHPF